MSAFKLNKINDRKASELRARARSKLFFALRKVAKARGVGKEILGKDLADAIGKDPGFVSRVLNGTNQTMDFETLVSFLEVLGYNVDLDVKSIEELASYRSNVDARPAQPLVTPRAVSPFVLAKPSTLTARNAVASGSTGGYNAK